MNKNYNIVLKSQLGPKSGTLRIRVSQARLLAVLELLGHKSLLTGRTLKDGETFEFKGGIWTPLGQSECLISGRWGDMVFQGTLKINNKIYELSGKE